VGGGVQPGRGGRGVHERYRQGRGDGVSGLRGEHLVVVLVRAVAGELLRAVRGAGQRQGLRGLARFDVAGDPAGGQPEGHRRGRAGRTPAVRERRGAHGAAERPVLREPAVPVVVALAERGRGGVHVHRLRGAVVGGDVG